jgi:membrane protein implicated in regulation of membrane protease activity
MQWAFLILALLAGLSELHTGTFYLAAIAAVAFVTFLLGFVLPDEALLMTFLGGLVVALVLVWLIRRRFARRAGLRDFDLGQPVTVDRIDPGTGRLVVHYRGTSWEAEMAAGAAPAPGAAARIVGRSGNRLRLAPLLEPPP